MKYKRPKINSAKLEMLDIKNKTIGDIFFEAATKWPDAIFFISPKTLATPMLELSYSKALKRANVYECNFKKAGYGFGDRVALLLGNRVEHYLIKIAANNLGMSVVPLNPDSSPLEVIYILNDSDSILIISDKIHINLINDINKLHIWSLCNDETCLTIHINCDMDYINLLLNKITLKLNKYKIYNITIQPNSL